MPELASIHIPKTAGRSFFQILQSVYPEGTVAHFEKKQYEDGPIGKFDQFKAGLGEEIRVIHGHFEYRDIIDLNIGNKMKVITWVRNPVDRVISNFSFFKKRIAMAVDDPELQRRKHESLMEYAILENSRNRMSKFMDGLDLATFYFIGITEQFDQDVRILGNMLNWISFRIPRINDNAAFKSGLPVVSQGERKEIQDLNQADIELYRKVIELRNNTHN